MFRGDLLDKSTLVEYFINDVRDDTCYAIIGHNRDCRSRFGDNVVFNPLLKVCYFRENTRCLRLWEEWLSEPPSIDTTTTTTTTTEIPSSSTTTTEPSITILPNFKTRPRCNGEHVEYFPDLKEWPSCSAGDWYPSIDPSPCDKIKQFTVLTFFRPSPRTWTKVSMFVFSAHCFTDSHRYGRSVESKRKEDSELERTNRRDTSVLSLRRWCSSRQNGLARKQCTKQCTDAYNGAKCCALVRWGRRVGEKSKQRSHQQWRLQSVDQIFDNSRAER